MLSTRRKGTELTLKAKISHGLPPFCSLSLPARISPVISSSNLMLRNKAGRAGAAGPAEVFPFLAGSWEPSLLFPFQIKLPPSYFNGIL